MINLLASELLGPRMREASPSLNSISRPRETAVMPEVGYCAAVKVRRERTIIGRPGNSARDLRRLGSAFAPRERRLGWLPGYRLSITLAAAASAADSRGMSTVASVGPEGRPHRPTARQGRRSNSPPGASSWATRCSFAQTFAEWRPSARLSVHSTAVLNGLRADGAPSGRRLGGTGPCRRSGRTVTVSRHTVARVGGGESWDRWRAPIRMPTHEPSRDTAMFQPDASAASRLKRLSWRRRT